MLIAFRFKNYRSFRDEAELSLVAHRADKVMRPSLISASGPGRTNFHLLPSVAIYGPNAAGKSNVLHALDYLRYATIHSHKSWSPDSGTALSGRINPSQVTEFEIDILIENDQYRYGLKSDSKIFNSEWLYAYPNGRERLLFDRETRIENGEAVTTIKAGNAFESDDRYIASIRRQVRGNSLFLSTATQENHPIAKKVRDWFERSLHVMPLDLDLDHLQYVNTCALALEYPDFREKLLNLIKLADPSIVDFEVEEGTMGEGQARLAEVLPAPFNEMMNYGLKDKIFFLISGDKKPERLPFNSESRGVRKIFALAGALLATLHNGGVFIIDELEASMHPHLARLIVDLFQNPTQNTEGAQLIFATHDTNILDQSLLRRDQIWFVEKDEKSSHLYSLLDFRPRKDEDLERGYLRGRYGAIPALNQTESWLSHIRDEVLLVGDDNGSPLE